MEVLTRRRFPSRVTRTLLASGLTLTIAACGGSDATAPTASCALTPPRGTMTAQVNGAPFTADFSTQATIQNGTALGPNIVQIGGVGCVAGTATSLRQILITIGRLTPITPGTYRLDPAAQAQPAGSGYSGIGQYVSAPNLWYSNLSDATGPGVGSVTFTTVTATRLAGTFSLTLVPVSSNVAGNTGRITIASGVFDIPTP